MSKFFLQSKTIIGAIIVALSMLAPVIGLDFSQGEATALSTKILAVIDSISEIVGLILIVWGRITADRPLHVVG